MFDELDEDIIIARVALSREYTMPEWSWEKIPLSKSAVFTYENCPNRYWRTYLLHQKQAPAPQLQFGRDLHDSLETVYDRLDEEQVTKGLDEQEFREHYRKELPKGEHFDTFVDLEWGRYEATEDRGKFFPVLREVFEYDDALQYYGRADRVDVDNKGDYVVVDYKSGKYRPYQDRNYRFELVGYKYLIDKAGILDRKIKYGCIVFLGEGGYIWFEQFKPASIRAFPKRVQRIREKIRASRPDKFEKKIGILCNWCPFNGPCLGEEIGIT